MKAKSTLKAVVFAGALISVPTLGFAQTTRGSTIPSQPGASEFAPGQRAKATGKAANTFAPGQRAKATGKAAKTFAPGQQDDSTAASTRSGATTRRR